MTGGGGVASADDRQSACPTSETPRRRNKHVAYLLQMFPKHSETFIVNELLAHQRRGAAVRVLSLRLPREGRFHGCLGELEDAAEYVPESFWEQPRKLLEAAWAALKNRPRGLLAALGLWLRRKVALRDVWQAVLVRRWAARRGVRHLHCHFGGFAATAAHLSHGMGGPSYSVTLHAHEIFRETVDTAFLRRVINDSAFCVTVTRFNSRHLIGQFAADSRKVRVLYNGIPLDRFAFSTQPREPGTIVAIGRLIEKKGFIHLVRACAALKERGLLTRCEIIGDGREKDALAAEIDRLNLNDVVKLRGAWPQERVAEALGRAAVFALPCIRAADGNMDALPTVILEAMATGCPVVSTNLSGVPEMIVNEQSGLLVEPGDEAGLANAIARVLNDSALARDFAVEGRRRVEQIFDVRQAVETLASWLDKAAKPDQAAAVSHAPAAESSSVALSREQAA